MKRSLLILFFLGLSNMLRLSAQTCLTSNLAAGKPVVASTLQSDAANVVDGNLSTEWQPTVSGDEWLYVDLGQTYTLCNVTLKWTTWHSMNDFKVQVSADTSTWTDVALVDTEATLAAGDAYQYHTVDLSSGNITARYVRFYFIGMTAYDAKLDEVEVYNKVPLISPVVSLTAPANGTYYTQGDSIVLQATATETGGAVGKVEFYQGSTKLGQSLAPPYSYTWLHVPEGDYSLTAKATDTSGYATASASISIHVEVPPPAWSLTGNRGTNADSNFIGRVDSSDIVFRTRSLQRMNVVASGNVGIGISSPVTKLHTTGSIRFAGLTSDTTKMRALVADSTGTLYYGNLSLSQQTNSVHQGGDQLGTNLIVGTKDNNNLDLYTNNQLRGRLTNAGNLLLGTTSDNGYQLQVNGGMSATGAGKLSTINISTNPVLSMITADSGKSMMIGSVSTNGFSVNGTRNIIMQVPYSSIAGLGGLVDNSVLIGGNSNADFAADTVKNEMVIANDWGYEQVYNGPMLKSRLLSGGGSGGFLRDDNPGGSIHMLNGYTGNIYLGYNKSNWIDSAHMPANYIQIGTNSHNLLALFGGFHATPPVQSTLAGPSMRPEGGNSFFNSNSYFRVGAGRGTGTGNGSDLRLAVAPPGASGTTLNPYVDAISISGTTGYVGIGTTSPQSMLAVNGTITAKKIVAIANGWPDYVFGKGYRLAGLRELEAYINKYRHLPGVTPAAVVIRKGLDLGANQAALLEKVEELTLYTLQQEKALKARRARLEKQQELIDELKEMIRKKMSSH